MIKSKGNGYKNVKEVKNITSAFFSLAEPITRHIETLIDRAVGLEKQLDLYSSKLKHCQAVMNGYGHIGWVVRLVEKYNNQGTSKADYKLVGDVIKILDGGLLAVKSSKLRIMQNRINLVRIYDSLEGGNFNGKIDTLEELENLPHRIHGLVKDVERLVNTERSWYQRWLWFP